jgi:hypothetical protein
MHYRLIFVHSVKWGSIIHLHIQLSENHFINTISPWDYFGIVNKKQLTKNKGLFLDSQLYFIVLYVCL